MQVKIQCPLAWLCDFMAVYRPMHENKVESIYFYVVEGCWAEDETVHETQFGFLVLIHLLLHIPLFETLHIFITSPACRVVLFCYKTGVREEIGFWCLEWLCKWMMNEDAGKLGDTGKKLVNRRECCGKKNPWVSKLPTQKALVICVLVIRYQWHFSPCCTEKCFICTNEGNCHPLQCFC